jgi:predicted nucleotidyltransferase component of viral defense system
LKIDSYLSGQIHKNDWRVKGLKNKSTIAIESQLRNDIRKYVVISMFSDDLLMERFVLKGGNAISMIYKISSRASIDIDLSIDGDFEPDVRDVLEQRIHNALDTTFQEKGYTLFDFKLSSRPSQLSDDLKDFWGGYLVEFKLVETLKFIKHIGNLEQLRKIALELGRGTKFSIDISKHEFTTGKKPVLIDNYTVYAYTQEMIIFEKLRAICQQMTEYGTTIKRSRPGSPRARDFYDIHALLTKFDINLMDQENIACISSIFAAKRVDIKLLSKIKDYRAFHSGNFNSVLATIDTTTDPKPFDFYFDFVISLVSELETLWNK